MSTEYINIKSSALQALFKNPITEYDRKVYFALCHQATFKHQVWGIYKRQSFTTLQNAVCALTDDKKQLLQVQRSVKKLENAKLIKVLHSKDELIISFEQTATLASVCSLIERNIEDFNIYADRIKELENNLSVKLNAKRKQSLAELNEGVDDIPFH